MIGPKHLRVIFDKKDRFARIYDETKYLVLLGPEKYDAIFKRTRYLLSIKSGITDVFSQYYVKSRLIPMILYLGKEDCEIVRL